MRNLLLLPLGIAAAGCEPDNNFTKLKPDIVVSPTNLDFGDVIVQYDSTLPIEINNAGREDLVVSSIDFVGVPSGMFELDTSEATIGIGETLPVNVTFTPHTYLPYTDTVEVLSDDEDQPGIIVRLFGNGVDGTKPDIAVDQLSMDFGAVELGEHGDGILTISNEGEGDLLIDQVLLEGDAFSLVSSLDGKTMAGGSETTLGIRYAPTDLAGDHATLSILSNDPDEDPVVVTLLGNGGGDYGFPVANFVPCPTDAHPLDTLYFFGSGSYDPYGFEPLTYIWSLERQPNGSRAEITGATQLTNLFVDLAGDYTARLVVENTVGIKSDPFDCSFTAIPDDLIHVELTWNTDDSDLDLHLVRSGSEFMDSPGDVCFCNQNPSWGSATSSADNPSLDLDDMFGYGPENINIESPADDSYTIYVHYYRDNGGGTSTATVNVYLAGELVAEEGETYTDATLLDGKTYWEVGTITWADGVGTYTPSDAEVTATLLDSCF